MWSVALWFLLYLANYAAHLQNKLLRGASSFQPDDKEATSLEEANPKGSDSDHTVFARAGLVYSVHLPRQRLTVLGLYASVTLVKVSFGWQKPKQVEEADMAEISRILLSSSAIPLPAAFPTALE